MDHPDLKASRQALAPAAPRTLEEARLPESMLIDLMLRTLSRAGELRAGELAALLCLPLAVIEPTLEFLRRNKLFEVPRRGHFDAEIAYALTEAGRARALDAFDKCRYVGPAPVALADYVAQVERQSLRGVRVDLPRMRTAIGDAVVPDALLARLGAALNSGRAIYLYGPSGSGKTYLAERIVRATGGTIFVPHAFHVDGEIVQIFDPLVHESAPGAPVEGLALRAVEDVRWVRVRRPVVVTGGELTLDMLDLALEPHSRFYIAPPQLKANGGMLVIDDLGRQRVPVRDLMNRWIVPLDRQVDYMALHTGTKFQVPFDVTVVFSSNLSPSEIGDPAFLRRLGYKIYVGALDEMGYRAVFRQACTRASLSHDQAGEDFLIHELHAKNRLPLYPTVPYDVISKVRDRAMFTGEAPRLDPESLRWAWSLYFAPDEEATAASTLDDLR